MAASATRAFFVFFLAEVKDKRRREGDADVSGKKRNKESRINRGQKNFRAKLQRRRRDSDHSAAMHPGSVNAALSAFTSTSLPSLSPSSSKNCTRSPCETP